MISFSRTNPYRNQQFARGKKWINRCVFCYYCNALLDPSSLQHPADDELELLQCVAGVEDEPVKPRRRNSDFKSQFDSVADVYCKWTV